jgi:chromosome segregation ATPase
MNRLTIAAVFVSLVTVGAASPHADGAPARAPRPTPARRAPSTAPTGPVAKATAELEQVEKRYRASFAETDEYKRAEADVKAAQAEHEAAIRAAVEKVKDQPEFAAALEALKKVEDEQFAIRSNPGAKAEPDLAARAMDARTAVHKLEIQAGDVDPAAKEAKAKLQAAKDALNAVRSRFEQEMHAQQDYTEAKKALDDARAQARKS